MQRAIGYLSRFITEFDIEDPDHDLAGFGDDEDENGEAVQTAGVGTTSENGTHATGSESYDDVFEPDRRKLKTAHEWMMEAEEGEEVGRDVQCASTALSFTGLRNSLCDVTATAGHCEDGTELHMPSSRRLYIDMMAKRDTSRSTWVSWLRRRWSPVKEYNLELLMLEEGRGLGLLERYLTEQTQMLEEAQAELIKLESQLEGVGVGPLSVGGDDGDLVVADMESAEVEPGDEALSQYSHCSQHGGDTSVSDSDEPRHRQSRLSEASTAQFINLSSETPERKVAAASNPGTRRSFFGMGRKVARADLGQVSREDMDGLVELWKASDEYTDSWTCSRADKHKVSTSGCQQQ